MGWLACARVWVCAGWRQQQVDPAEMTALTLQSACAVGGPLPWLNWAALGPFFLTLLFVPPGASLDVTEALSSRKYNPAYKAYQASVSRFIPWPPPFLPIALEQEQEEAAAAAANARARGVATVGGARSPSPRRQRRTKKES